MPFRAVTYNILATAYIKPEWYESVAPELLLPEWRVPALVRHVKALNADLLCLQEVENRTFAALDERLKQLGYRGCFEKKGKQRPDGCAVFFRESKFTLRTAERLDYHDGKRGSQDDSGHIALMLCLEHKGQLLGLANTHIRWDRPGTPRDEQIGYRQIGELLEARERFTPACQGWLVCGDFNCTADSDPVDAMRRAGFSYAHAERPHARSCVANGKAQLIDFLFHNRGLLAQPIDPPMLTDEMPLPSLEQPSDHIALAARFDWT